MGDGGECPRWTILSPSKISSAGFHIIELLVTTVPCKPQTTQAIAQAVGCSS